MSDAKLTELGSGVRVVTEEVPSVRSVALGLWVRTGSRNETPAQAGVSHFLEHLLFKGTARYDAIEISERFARAVLAAVDARAPDTLVLSGGDTALAVLDALGIGVVRPLGEAAPGLPWFLIERPARPALRCIVKSGGFGGADTLVNLLPK